MLTRDIEETLHRALALAAERNHEYATVEHLLYALTDDPDAKRVLEACAINIDKLRDDLIDFINGRLTRLPARTAEDPKVGAEFQRVINMAAIDIQRNGGSEVNGADVLEQLFKENESDALRFLQKQAMTQLDAVNFIHHGLMKSREKRDSKETSTSKARYFPPNLPDQGIGPHVEIGPLGQISFPPPESIDRAGNFLPRLYSLHPEIQEIARDLSYELGLGNIPHPTLKKIIDIYADLLDKNLDLIDFRRLYAAGVRLANAAYATEAAITKGDEPPLEVSAQEKLGSLLALHGPFILATEAGAEAVAEEERYKRRPAEELRYRKEAVEISRLLRDRLDLLKPDVADYMLDAALEIEKGPHPERSDLAGRAIVRNVMIAVASGALASVVFQHIGVFAGSAASFVGTLTFSESIKKASWFRRLTRSIASRVDDVMDDPSAKPPAVLRAALGKHAQFMSAHETMLCRLAENRDELGFLLHALDWFKENKESSED